MKTKYGFNMLWMYAGGRGRIPQEANERELDFIAEEGFNFISIGADVIGLAEYYRRVLGKN